MENILLIYVTAFGIAASVLAIFAMRSDESRSRKWVRVRVRVDENSNRQFPKPDEEEVETHGPLQWLLLGGMFLLIILLANAA
jgi:hypothetical protein